MTIQEMVENNVDKELEYGSGYFLGFQFSKNETEKILGFVHQQWIARIKKKCPEHWEDFAKIGIARYHELAHLIDHGSAWGKEARIFSKEVSEKIRKMTLIKSLEKAFGPIEIVDEENVGYEEIDWRLVRPNQPSDVGPMHADVWFRRLGHGVNPPAGQKAIKIWVALCCESGLNGLMIVPDSQKTEWRYHGEFRHGFVKPQIDEDQQSLNSILLDTNPGDAVVFHEKLLHAGAVNKGKFTRVSMEFMAFVRN